MYIQFVYLEKDKKKYFLILKLYVYRVGRTDPGDPMNLSPTGPSSWNQQNIYIVNDCDMTLNILA